MFAHPALIRLAHQFSARTWMVVVGLSFLLAFGSTLVLAVNAGVPLPQPLGDWYKSAELFVRDTIRLTFRPRFKNKRIAEVSETVFMAPVGILEERRNFVWLEAVSMPVQPQEEQTGVQKLGKGPSRLLEPDWQPEFKGN